MGVEIVDAMRGDSADPASLLFLRLAQGFTLFGTFFLSAIFWANYESKPFTETLSTRQANPKHYLIAIGVILCCFPLANWLYIIQPENLHLPQRWVDAIVQREASASKMLAALLGDLSPSAIILNFTVVAIIPALSEEFFFRGFMLTSFRRMMNGHLAVWLTAILFSALHFQFLGFGSRLALGVAFGYLVLRSGSIWLSVAGHFAFNLLQLVIVWVGLIEGDSIEAISKAESIPIPGWLAGISLVLSVVLILLIKNRKEAHE